MKKFIFSLIFPYIPLPFVDIKLGVLNLKIFVTFPDHRVRKGYKRLKKKKAM